MASWIQWAWVWVNSRSWWWTGRPGMLQSMGLQRVRHDWATELSWTVLLLMWFQKSLFREVWCSFFFPPHWWSSYPWFYMGKVLFLWLLSRFFSLSLSFYSFNMKCLDTDFFGIYPGWNSLEFPRTVIWCFSLIFGNSQTLLFHIFLSFFSFSYTHYMCYTFCNCFLVLG